MTAIAIRARRDSDLPACVDVLAQVHAKDGYPAKWPADPVAWLDASDTLGAWVALDPDGLVGHVALAAAPAELPEPIAALGKSSGELALAKRLFVAPAARGRGLSRTLLATVYDNARAAGRHLTLDVIGSGRAAIQVYENLGWRRLGTEPARWTLPSGERPTVHYYTAPS